MKIKTYPAKVKDMFLDTYQSRAHVEADIFGGVHYGVGQSNVEAITEHGNTEWSSDVRLIEAGKGTSRTIRPENSGSQ